ncbi:MAG: DNA polymerase/3'-5' exonuclease PolX [Actinomycetota bacterium]|nr:DNA polymerase/3'-5' exonuclease PolX [Actinomycetota bacterium]
MATTLPRNADVADQFELLADLLELEGTDTFQVLAYRRAASLIRETPRPIAELALAGRAKELPGIGATIEGKIVQIAEVGEMEALTKGKQRVPPEVVSFMRLPGLGPKTVRRIWQELGVTTVDELRRAAELEQLRTLRGLGAKTEENVLRALAAKPAGPPRTLLGAALPALLAVVALLRDHPAAELVCEAGSARRRRETVRDLDIIATASDPKALTAYLTELEWVAEVSAHGPTKATVLSQNGLRFDLRVVPPHSYGNLLQHFTGSKHHNVALREDAVRRGLSVSEYGVQDVETREVFQTRSEEELYEYLGYQFIPPELRENRGELEAARRGGLPARLVEHGDLRGDLHTHTNWSDGRNTVEEMAVAARARGYEYLAICDHAQRLRGGGLARQAAEIDALRERVEPLRLLRGVEVNVRADGSLDVPDDELAACDWVVASVHSGFDRDPTGRILAAMDNPHVDCIGHPTGRKINRREPGDVDVTRLIESALATGTALEINSQPDRLDLIDAHARAAAEAGAQVVVNSDGHGVETLQYVELGIAQARRGWLTADHVLNTRPWREIAP